MAIRSVFDQYASLLQAKAVSEEPSSAVAASPPHSGGGSPQKPIAVTGWLRSARKQKQYTFLEVSDGSTPRNLQVMWNAADNDAVLTKEGGAAALDRLGVGACVRVEGVVVPSPKPAQPIEVQATSVTIVGDCPQEPYPLQRKAHSPEFLRQMMHLRPRTAAVGSMLRVRSTLSLAIHNFFAAEGFTQVHTPVLTANDCEGAGELFEVRVAGGAGAGTTTVAGTGAAGAAEHVRAAASAFDSSAGEANKASAKAPAKPAASASSKAGGNAASAAQVPSAGPAGGAGFFGKPVYLTVSGQLHLEAFALALSRVYTFGPTFRAENSNTARHLAEFWMIEPEMAPGTMQDAVSRISKSIALHRITAPQRRRRVVSATLFVCPSARLLVCSHAALGCSDSPSSIQPTISPFAPIPPIPPFVLQMGLAERCVRSSLASLLCSATSPAFALAHAADTGMGADKFGRRAGSGGPGALSHSDLALHFAAKASSGAGSGGSSSPGSGSAVRAGASLIDASALKRAEAVAGSPSPFARISYSDAIRILQAAESSGAARFKERVSWDEGLATEHERYLAERYVGGPVFVHDYPAAVKAFYMRANEDYDEQDDNSGGQAAAAAGAASGSGTSKRRQTVAAFDLLLPGVGELVGGSAREDRWDVLALKMAHRGLLSPALAEAVLRTGGSAAAAGIASGSTEEGRPAHLSDSALAAAVQAAKAMPPADCDGAHLDWYLDLRRFGGAPHAGWGMGFERLVLFATGLDNIRDAIPIPRVPDSCRM